MEPNSEQPQSERLKLTVSQTATRLGITAEAVRQRIRRGSLESTKEQGTVYVLLDADDTQPHAVQTDDQTLLLERLDSEVKHLRGQLEAANERDREQRRIIAALTQRIPELPAATPPESPAEWAGDERERRTEASTGSSKGQPPSDSQTTTQRPSLWRRIFGS